MKKTPEQIATDWTSALVGGMGQKGKFFGFKTEQEFTASYRNMQRRIKRAKKRSA